MLQAMRWDDSVLCPLLTPLQQQTTRVRNSWGAADVLRPMWTLLTPNFKQNLSNLRIIIFFATLINYKSAIVHFYVIQKQIKYAFIKKMNGKDVCEICTARVKNLLKYEINKNYLQKKKSALLN